MAAGAAGLFLPNLNSYGFSKNLKNTSSNDQINIGSIGINGMGWANTLKALKVPGVNLVAVCDVDQNAIVRRLNDKAVADIKDKIKIYSDYRKMLEQDDIDVVYIGTPDHWHAIPTIAACQAGKDVYCEKPLTLRIGEGRAMVEAARQNGRVVQTGSQQRSGKEFLRAATIVRSGDIGETLELLDKLRATVGISRVINCVRSYENIERT